MREIALPVFNYLQSRIEMLKYYLVIPSITMETVSVKFEDDFFKDVKKAMKKHRYTTTTEFVREAVRDKIIDLEKQQALMRLEKVYGMSKRKTTDEELHKIREKIFWELDKKLPKLQ